MSVDRRRVAFVSAGALWVENVDGSGKHRIGEVPAGTEIYWSADGHKLGLTLAEGEDGPTSIAVADLATTWMVGLSSDGSYAAFARDGPPSLWVVGTTGGTAHLAMTLASDEELGPCPKLAWSPKTPVLAIANAPCAPS